MRFIVFTVAVVLAFYTVNPVSIGGWVLYIVIAYLYSFGLTTAIGWVYKALDKSVPSSLFWRRGARLGNDAINELKAEHNYLLAEQKRVEAYSRLRKTTQDLRSSLNERILQDAKEFVSEGNFPEAIERLEILTKEKDYASIALGLIGAVYKQTGDDFKAVGYIGQAIELDPSDPNLYFIRANSQIDKDEAIADLERAVSLSTQNLRAISAYNETAKLQGWNSAHDMYLFHLMQEKRM